VSLLALASVGAIQFLGRAAGSRLSAVGMSIGQPTQAP
jgi:hypothetical protein